MITELSANINVFLCTAQHIFSRGSFFRWEGEEIKLSYLSILQGLHETQVSSVMYLLIKLETLVGVKSGKIFMTCKLQSYFVLLLLQ